MTFLTAFAAYEGLDAVCETLNEAVVPTRLERIMTALGLDFVDQFAVKWFLFDRKLKRFTWVVKKVEGLISKIKG